MFKKQLGDLVKNERVRRGLSQNTLAEYAQVSLRTISDIETYKGNPTLETVYSLVKYLNISLDSIFLSELNKSDEMVTQLIMELRDCTDEQCVLVLSTLRGLISGFREIEDL